MEDSRGYEGKPSVMAGTFAALLFIMSALDFRPSGCGLTRTLASGHRIRPRATRPLRKAS